jgi:putative cell wall-binding protein
MGPTDKAVLVNGEAGHYPDALAISPYAASNGIPILFTEAARLPAETAQALTTQNIGTTIVVGGEGAVAAAVFNQLPGAGRYGGADRYATAVAVIEGLEHKLTEIYVVTGLNFPDALTAGNLASYTQSPLLMVDNGLPEAIKTFLTTTKTAVTEIKIIGGKGVITDAQVNAIFEILK